MHPILIAVIVVFGFLLIVRISWKAIFRIPPAEPAFVIEDSGILIIKINLTKLDYRNCNRLRPIIFNVLIECHSSVILDMSNVEYIASDRFLGLLVRLGHGASKAGGKMVLVGLKQPVRQLICEILKIDKAYPVFENLEDAKSFLNERDEL